MRRNRKPNEVVVKPASDGPVRMLRRYRGKVVKYRSGYEDKIIKDLEERKIEYAYEPKTFVYQRPVRRALCDTCGGGAVSVSRRYTPDILLKAKDIYVEAKGKFTSENRSAMEDFLGGSPGIDLRFMFMRDNFITAKHKSKYSDWCIKLGVKYHIGDKVPQEWVST
jgi:hypothetical protein